MYEFDPIQERQIRELAQKMRFVGYCWLAFGILLVIDSLSKIAQGEVTEATSSVLYGLIQFLIGFWTRQAAGSFRSIVETRGNDIANLMKAIAELRNLYNLQYWLLLIMLAVAC
ncbi:MAG: hypothetical protein HC890_04670 [Chloroflexaceae bacterium]|nr:hypothetical protein [Chloroflexaceae bacterium]